MDEDPGVKARIFFYDIHPTVSFPGDSLPKQKLYIYDKSLED